MHIRVFRKGRVDRKGNIIFMNTLGLMHSTTLRFLCSIEQNMFSNIKKSQSTQLFLRLSIRPPAFVAKAKGHVSRPASQRGNYPFPVTKQQMIANYLRAFAGAEMLSIGKRERGIIFRQLHIYFLKSYYSMVICLHMYLCMSVRVRERVCVFIYVFVW